MKNQIKKNKKNFKKNKINYLHLKMSLTLSEIKK